MPDFSLERALAGPHGGRVAGVDEVGRGPWAGPVVTAAVILQIDRMPGALLDQITDSKALPAARRTRIAADLTALAAGPAPALHLAFGAASVAEIDRMNILQATFLAMRRAVIRLPVMPDAALIDGNRVPPGLPCPAQAVVEGDGQSLSIAAASILAKDLRDRMMARLHRRYPAYGWDRNAGYGVPDHRKALEDQGVTRHHRFSFKPIAEIIQLKGEETPNLASE